MDSELIRAVNRFTVNFKSANQIIDIIYMETGAPLEFDSSTLFGSLKLGGYFPLYSLLLPLANKSTI